ncbi:MAG TPA: hypothetical protein VJK54_07235 [Chthoniobacterales bacterium]|nr:hypothetical protein [Chthoniobacterales bacterium]
MKNRSLNSLLTLPILLTLIHPSSILAMDPKAVAEVVEEIMEGSEKFSNDEIHQAQAARLQAVNSEIQNFSSPLSRTVNNFVAPSIFCSSSTLPILKKSSYIEPVRKRLGSFAQAGLRAKKIWT